MRTASELKMCMKKGWCRGHFGIHCKGSENKDPCMTAQERQ